MSREKKDYTLLGIIISIVGIIITFYFSNKSAKSDEDSATVARAKAIIEYQDRVSSFIAENNNLIASKKNALIPIEFKTNYNGKIFFCINYRALDNRWITRGYFAVQNNNELNLNQITDNRRIYVCITNKDIGRNDIYINGKLLNSSNFPTITKKIKEKESFDILDVYSPPYETVESTFYTITIPTNNEVAIEVGSRFRG